MTRRLRLALVLVALAAAGCAGGPRVEAPAPPPAQTVREGGLALTAVADQWRAFPPDLDRYYLAIETIIENDRDAAVPLRVEDFALADGAGGTRTAVAPREATLALFGTYGRRQSEAVPSPAIRPVTTYFGFGARFGYPYSAWPYYGPYYDPYWYPPPGYYPTPRRRTYEEATGDLIRYGLQPGSIEPKATVQGFLYFPRGEGETTNLRLRWAAPGLAAPLAAPVAGD